jgi:hypothetical protein
VAQNVCRVAQSGTVSVLDANVVNAGTQGTLEIRIAAVAALTFDTTKNAQFAAGVQVPVVTKTGNYTLVEGDVCVFADATSASLTLTLPAANIAGAGFTPIIRIKRIDSTAGKTVTVSRAGADTIDGGTSTVLGSLQAVDLISDGVSKWGIV